MPAVSCCLLPTGASRDPLASRDINGDRQRLYPLTVRATQLVTACQIPNAAVSTVICCNEGARCINYALSRQRMSLERVSTSLR